ncbi:hypothetical protein AnigIFM63604_003094 [Aspergillus niger]|uniref:Uncharacterized protein n=1 Tax=Aspergillus niger TaxID=5061 RepID=A0A9W6ABB5_ASPNG|nr:hypothetical protein AnigIFM63604_003094 [Aspergillus niger]
MQSESRVEVHVEEIELHGIVPSIERALQDGQAVWQPTDEGHLVSVVEVSEQLQSTRFRDSGVLGGSSHYSRDSYGSTIYLDEFPEDEFFRQVVDESVDRSNIAHYHDDGRTKALHESPCVGEGSASYGSGMNGVQREGDLCIVVQHVQFHVAEVQGPGESQDQSNVPLAPPSGTTSSRGSNELQEIHDSPCRIPSFILSNPYTKYATSGASDAPTPPPSPSPTAGPFEIVGQSDSNYRMIYDVQRQLQCTMVAADIGNETWFEVYKIPETELMKLQSGDKLLDAWKSALSRRGQ